MNKNTSGNLSFVNHHLAPRTAKTYLRYLGNFSDYLVGTGRKNVPSADELFRSPDAWAGVTAGTIEAFRTWLVDEGYSPSSITGNVHIVRRYARLASKVGAISHDEASRINLISCAAPLVQTDDETVRRKGAKRRHSEMIALNTEQRRLLKAECDLSNPQGRRDFLLVCLLMDHALRSGEVEALQVGDVNLEDGTLHFYREKSKEYQTIQLSADTMRALLLCYQNGDLLRSGSLLRASRKGKHLDGSRISRTAIAGRIATLSVSALGVRLSPHDLRHTWATYMAHTYPEKREQIKQAAGWKSDVMLNYYVRPSKIANESINVSL